MGILTGEIEDKTLKDKIHYNRGDVVRAETINDIQDTAIDAHNMATEALDKADSVFQGNGTVVSVGGREVGTLAFSSDPQQQLDTLNAKITTSSSFNAEIVEQLPTTNISTSTFYLIKNSTSADDNTYSEYLYVNGKWELLGNTQVQAYDDSELRELINGLSTTKANKTDLANYYTKDQTYNITEVDAKVINLVSTSYLKSELNPIKTDVNTNKTNIATLQTDIVGKADKADLDNYTKTSDLAKVATSNDYNDLDNTPNTDLMVEIINEHSESLNEINAELAGKADKGSVTANTNAISTINNKLSGIQSGAEVNVQSDWNVTDTSSDAYIKNKPTIPSISGLASETYVNTQVDTLQVKIDDKQDTISDLATIRSGASAGATAVQPSALDAQVSTLQGNIDKKVDKTTTINSKPLSSNITLSASDVGALADTTKYGASLSLTMNTSTYVVTAQLKDQAGNNLGNAQTIDLPLESVVVSGSYDATNKKVILTLKDGSTIDFSVADLVSGLVQDTRNIAGIDLKDDITTTELSTALNLSQYANKVTSVNGKTGAVSLGAGDVGALPNTTVIPKLYDEMGENVDGAVTQKAFYEIIIALGDEFGGVINELNTNKANKSDLDAKYTKPSTGIPKTDLASDVQTSLGKADTALQSIPAEYITETELNAKGYASQSDLDEYLPLTGGDMTGAINHTYSGSTDYSKTELSVNGNPIISTVHEDGSKMPTTVNFGSTSSSVNLRGKNTNPKYNNNDLALKSDVITKTSQLENDAGFITTAPEGVALYETTGSNTDGAMTQKATTDELNKKVSKGTTLVGGQLAQYTTNGTLETTGITPTDVMTLSTAQTVSGAKSFNANNHLIATCNTAYSSTTKTASLTGFTSSHFTDGCEIYVKFVNGNTAGSRTSPVTLNVNSAGAKTMVVAESATLGSYNQNINLFGQWANNDIIKFRYDATYNYWVAVENVTQHKLYGFANTTLYSTTGTSETAGMTQKAITDALSGKANTSDIPDISNLATKNEIPDISNLATKDEIPDITGKIDKINNPTESNIACIGDNGGIYDSGLHKGLFGGCILEAPNGVLVSSDTRVTAKAGLRVLIPNGLNTDGTPKFIDYTLGADKGWAIGTYSSYVGVLLQSNGNLVRANGFKGYHITPPEKNASSTEYYINTSNNTCYTHDANEDWRLITYPFIFLGMANITSSAVLNISPTGVGVPNKGLMNYMSMIPNATFDLQNGNITAETTITAQATGYLCVYTNSNPTKNGYIELRNTSRRNLSLTINALSGYQQRLLLPVIKWDKVTISLTSGYNLHYYIIPSEVF